MAKWTRMTAAAALIIASGAGSAGAEHVAFTMKNYPRNYLGTIQIVSLDEPRKRWHAEIEREELQNYVPPLFLMTSPARPRELFGNNPDAKAAFDLPPGWYTVTVAGYESKTFFVDLRSAPHVILRRTRPDGRGARSFPGSINHTGRGGGDGGEGGGGGDD